ncbi:MAG: hypothetical protein H6Q15_1152 [Bacteroidetes bacterium]|nr:hypothetical protein [Bacteroidota bacterium]
MKIIKSLVKNILWKIWTSKTLKYLDSLEQESNPKAKRLAILLRQTIKGEFSKEEMQWIEKIENLRADIEKNTSKVNVIDYGAGNPQDNRSEREMYNGTINTSRVCDINIASKRPFWAKVLFKIIREFKPQTAIELGTCLGISSAYQSSAMILNNSGRLITMEGSPELVKIADSHIKGLGISNVEIIEGRFQDNLERILEENKPIDYVFIDGHHDENATIDYYNLFIPYLKDGAVLVFDDISWSKGMKNAWKIIQKDKNIQLAVNFKEVGICIFENKNK